LSSLAGVEVLGFWASAVRANTFSISIQQDSNGDDLISNGYICGKLFGYDSEHSRDLREEADFILLSRHSNDGIHPPGKYIESDMGTLSNERWSLLNVMLIWRNGQVAERAAIGWMDKADDWMAYSPKQKYICLA
jgi:hypothetical protein